MALNSFCAQGRVASDIKVSNIEDDKRAVVTFSLAVSRNYKTTGQNGEEIRPTDFLFCKAFGKTAQFLNKYFEKGQVVVISNAEVRKDDNYEKDGETVYGQMYVHLNVGSILFNEQNRNDNNSTQYDNTRQSNVTRMSNNPLANAMNKKKAVI